MIPREVNVPESRIFRLVDDAIQKALDGWFVFIGFAANDVSDEALDSFTQKFCDIVVSHTDHDTALKLEVAVEPPVFSIGRRLFLTRRETCDLSYRAGESPYRIVGVGKDGLEYERV